MFLSRSQAHQLVKTHLPANVADAVLDTWNSRWRGAQIYISTRQRVTPATERWRADTLKAIESVSASPHYLEKIQFHFRGYYIRF